MAFTDEQLRAAREAERKIGLIENKSHQDGLIVELGDGLLFKAVAKRLGKKKPPAGTNQYTWSVSEEVDSLRLLFFSCNVEDFTRQDGKIDLLMAMWTARELILTGPVRITREYSRSKGTTYTLQVSDRYQVLRETGKSNKRYSLKRPLTGFAGPSGVSASPRPVL